MNTGMHTEVCLQLRICIYIQTYVYIGARCMPVDEYERAYASGWMQPTVVFVGESSSCARELLLRVDPQVLICGSGASQPPAELSRMRWH